MPEFHLISCREGFVKTHSFDRVSGESLNFDGAIQTMIDVYLFRSFLNSWCLKNLSALLINFCVLDKNESFKTRRAGIRDENALGNGLKK